jgi:3-carboxy-cis,cis-muconate cycloisomerase
MRENITEGMLSEHAAMVLAEHLGRGRAKDLVEAAARRAVADGRTLRDVLVDDAAVREHLSPEEIDEALDPASYLGSADALIDRALATYERLRR